MCENNEAEIALLKQQLERVKLQDGLLEKIEIELGHMKMIAQYAKDQNLTQKARAQLNDKVQERKQTIQKLEKELGKIKLIEQITSETWRKH